MTDQRRSGESGTAFLVESGSFADDLGAYDDVSLKSGDDSLGVGEVLTITEAHPAVFDLVWYQLP